MKNKIKFKPQVGLLPKDAYKKCKDGEYNGIFLLGRPPNEYYAVCRGLESDILPPLKGVGFFLHR